jgi:hypothetical protein
MRGAFSPCVSTVHGLVSILKQNDPFHVNFKVTTSLLLNIITLF